VNWVLELDIRGFYDSIDHGWLVKFVEHRIADRRVVRLIQKWLNAGVLEDGKRNAYGGRDAAGSSISPLLANVYLHYAFEPVGPSVARKYASGDMIVVRFADDIVLGFQYKSDAERFWKELEERFRKFRLELHPDKTRLLEFGPYAVDQRKRRGQAKPETFNFLGFTHICGKKRSNGRFTCCGRRFVRVASQAERGESPAQATPARLRPGSGKWLRSVVEGHNRYYGVPMNSPALRLFRFHVSGSGIVRCRGAVRTAACAGTGMWRLVNRWLPPLHASIILIPAPPRVIT